MPPRFWQNRIRMANANPTSGNWHKFSRTVVQRDLFVTVRPDATNCDTPLRTMVHNDRSSGNR